MENGDDLKLIKACKRNGPSFNAPPLSQLFATEAVPLNGDESPLPTIDPVIARYRAILKGVQSNELERLYRRLPELDERSRIAILNFADRVVEKMLNPPLECLNSAFPNGSQHELLDSLERLFQLQQQG